MTNLSVSSKVVAIGSVVTISAVATNPNPTNSSYNVTCFVNGTLIGSKIVKLTPTASQTVSFEYIPNEEGTLNVTMSIPQNYILSTSFTAFDIPRGYWLIQYNVANGSKITLNYSLAKATAYRKDLTLTRGDGIVTLYVNQAVINGTRAVILPKEGWQIKGIKVDDISPGVGMLMTFSLDRDATGTLYVESGKGDVDMSSVSSTGREPIQANTFGDGTKDPAGSMLVPTVLAGLAKVTVGVDVSLPFELIFTTGHIVNTVSLSKSKFDKATLASDGVH
jgi:hypothetical protein